jgi:periplasmic copper chaperone A
MTKLISSVLLCLLSAAAQAHIVLDKQSAPAGSYYRGALKVGHGCSGSPVTQVIVMIPEGVQGAKPMPKPGWKIDIQRATLAKPYVSHGRTVTEDVREISWTARTAEDYLPDAYYDEFVVSAKLPATAGKLYWRTSQICVQGRIDWHEIPAGDAKLKTPAAMLEVTAVPETAGHHHAH